ncbi:L,D-transpeptidase family protein [Paraliomyxa miuraensis]|uniref:L,D-transpeptidase family protein n=1 Tax=Paraliomyxa miuraensis TaxID=376150 RepID=UPI00224D56A8|nr:L,D-transpeptidase family protein [Paraliomyxa miuraensis]MCX4245673.1 L,D-transpeptidase family protein [Paraliomyxa miuraensis]
MAQLTKVSPRRRPKTALALLALVVLASSGLGCDSSAEAREGSAGASAPTPDPEPSPNPGRNPDPSPAKVPADATHATSMGSRSSNDAVGSSAGRPATPQALRLTRPPMREPADVARYHATPPVAGSRTALAYQFDAPVFHLPSGARRIAGVVRRNSRLAVDRWVPGEGCGKSWYALVGGGYVCSGDGFSVASDPAPLSEALATEPPAVDQALPYRYAKVDTPAPLYWRVPSESELATGATAPIRERAQGAHFVAMDQRLTVAGEALSRTVRGYYVRDRDLQEKPAPTMHGERLSGRDALPLAFVYVDDAPLLDPDTGTLRGTAERFARFPVAELRERDGQRHAVSPEGFGASLEHVRIASATARPDEVGATDQWIHVDLDQQVLVAYEGDAPVLATLVSSGKEGFEPPLGLFRVHKKYTSVTMSGPDPDAGTYAVEEVPWTMYYWASFALHGAYWHDEFGKVRSHGCTNVPPVDARWLFHWARPELPTGWHAEVGLRGPWVYFTRGADPSASASTTSL